ncbi:MAG: hypothetical protein KF753_17375 [Caldilineaceae bacterium]|nr:hypothetical protein [Caldilineaceae bacterium]
MPTLAYFITPHGFGHAARACAVMAAVQRHIPDLRWEIFTRTPEWFFAESLTGPFALHPTDTDVGLVQVDALRADLPATVERLAGLLPFSWKRVEMLAAQVKALHCRAVLCDIAPLGIAVAQTAGLPSVLLENFTWVDIYGEYIPECPALRPYSEQMADWFAAADFHIQTSPVCNPSTNATLTVPPVSRSPRTGRSAVRNLLSIPDEHPFLLITMGGVDFQHSYLERLSRFPHVHFVLPGNHSATDTPSNVHLLSPRSGIFHPDIVAASDGVVGKIGYSTLAEVYAAGVPYGYVPRPRFRESDVLSAFVEKEMAGFAIDADELGNGRWIERIPDLLALPPRMGERVNGATAVAGFLGGLV